MKPVIECGREVEILEAVASGRWPDRTPDLQAHVSACAICADLADVAAAMAMERDEAWREGPPLPSGQLVWWRAQVRARAEAAALASRPMTIVQALGLVCAGAVALAFGSDAEWGIRTWMHWLGSTVPAAVSVPDGGTDVIALAVRGTLLAVGVWLVLAPVAVYLATEE